MGTAGLSIRSSVISNCGAGVFFVNQQPCRLFMWSAVGAARLEQQNFCHLQLRCWLIRCSADSSGRDHPIEVFSEHLIIEPCTVMQKLSTAFRERQGTARRCLCVEAVRAVADLLQSRGRSGGGEHGRHNILKQGCFRDVGSS